MVDKNFWNGKKVFLTGHTGFKGSWLSIWLSSLGSEVRGYSLDPQTSPSLYNEARIYSIIDSHIGDIRDQEKLYKSMIEFNPDIVIHMAAQPLVRDSYEVPIDTFDINVIGTAKVFEVARSCDNLKVILNITTDKCYENDGRQYGYSESDPMGGYDPYSSSKGCAELVTSAYYQSYFQDLNIGLASVRAGNVIGGGDWAEDRLIPDILRSFAKGEPVMVRNPKAIRPWQHVLEPLSGYLTLAQSMCNNPNQYSGGWNFGPRDEDAKSVEWILNRLMEKWPGSSWELDQGAHPHEASFLKLDTAKASSLLEWDPVWSLNTTLGKIVDWYHSWRKGENMQAVCLAEIDEYMEDASK